MQVIYLLDSDVCLTNPKFGGNGWDLGGTNPTFELSVGGIGGSPRRVRRFNNALESYFNATVDGEEQTCG